MHARAFFKCIGPPGTHNPSGCQPTTYIPPCENTQYGLEEVCRIWQDCPLWICRERCSSTFLDSTNNTVSQLDNEIRHVCASIQHAAEDLLPKLSCKRKRKNVFKDHHLKSYVMQVKLPREPGRKLTDLLLANCGRIILWSLYHKDQLQSITIQLQFMFA